MDWFLPLCVYVCVCVGDLHAHGTHSLFITSSVSTKCWVHKRVVRLDAFTSHTKYEICIPSSLYWVSASRASRRAHQNVISPLGKHRLHIMLLPARTRPPKNPFGEPHTHAKWMENANIINIVYLHISNDSRIYDV